MIAGRIASLLVRTLGADAPRGRVLVILVAVAGVGALSATTALAGVAVPNLSGSWAIVSKSGGATGSDTVTFKRTAPHTYTVAVGSGGATTNVRISKSSFVLWSCGASASGATYSNTARSKCPATSGHWLEDWHFNFSHHPFTARGSFQQYAADGSTTDESHGTFTATGPRSH